MGTAVDMRPAMLAGDVIRDLRAAADVLEQKPEIEVGTTIVFRPDPSDPVFGDLFVQLAGRRFVVTSVFEGGAEFGVSMIEDAGDVNVLVSVIGRGEAEAVPSRYALALAQTYRQVADTAERLDMDIPHDSMIGRILATAREVLPAVTA